MQAAESVGDEDGELLKDFVAYVDKDGERFEKSKRVWEDWVNTKGELIKPQNEETVNKVTKWMGESVKQIFDKVHSGLSEAELERHFRLDFFCTRVGSCGIPHHSCKDRNVGVEWLKELNERQRTEVNLNMKRTGSMQDSCL